MNGPDDVGHERLRYDLAGSVMDIPISPNEELSVGLNIQNPTDQTILVEQIEAIDSSDATLTPAGLALDPPVSRLGSARGYPPEDWEGVEQLIPFRAFEVRPDSDPTYLEPMVVLKVVSHGSRFIVEGLRITYRAGGATLTDEVNVLIRGCSEEPMTPNGCPPG